MIVFSLLGLNQVDYQQNNQVSHLRHKIQSGHYHLSLSGPDRNQTPSDAATRRALPKEPE